MRGREIRASEDMTEPDNDEVESNLEGSLNQEFGIQFKKPGVQQPMKIMDNYRTIIQSSINNRNLSQNRSKTSL